MGGCPEIKEAEAWFVGVPLKEVENDDLNMVEDFRNRNSFNTQIRSIPI